MSDTAIKDLPTNVVDTTTYRDRNELHKKFPGIVANQINSAGLNVTADQTTSRADKAIPQELIELQEIYKDPKYADYELAQKNGLKIPKSFEKDKIPGVSSNMASALGLSGETVHTTGNMIQIGDLRKKREEAIKAQNIRLQEQDKAA